MTKTINILGYTYDLDVSGDSYTSTYGTFNSRDQIIRVAKDLHDENSASTVLHEIIEALNFHLHIGLEEDGVVRLETGLYQALSENGYLNIEQILADLREAREE